MSYYWGAVSIFALALTAINRYFCIVKPQHYKALLTKKENRDISRTCLDNRIVPGPSGSI